ncbi:MAG: aminotransferase class I/II-fold pyridoxal phosphate-dependent enzyme, partial [Actinobacteria bacterium]|nr:aminotransferase class I/II-fold pyridoxal phosphate-dependent enzyme [Actinomycetota bacterium]
MSDSITTSWTLNSSGELLGASRDPAVSSPRISTRCGGGGDVVVVEQPTFPGAIDLFARAGARLVAVPVDAGGTDVEALSRALDRGGVRAVYLVPTCHSPTGTTTTAARRRAIAALV